MPKCRLISAMLSLLIGIPPLESFGQEKAQSTPFLTQKDSARAPEFFGHSDPAPTWAVWRAFHSSFQFRGRQSLDIPYSILESEVGISRDSADNIMNLGRKYLQTLDHLQEEVSRLGGRGTLLVSPEILRATLTPPDVRRGPTEADLALQSRRAPLRPLLATAGEGRQRVPMESGDSGASFEERARSAIEDHQQQLIGLIGAHQFDSLQRWVDSSFGEHVRVPRHELQTAPPGAVR